MVFRWIKDKLFGDNLSGVRTRAIGKAREMEARLPVIFDTETTGLETTDEIVEIACVDIAGKVLLDTLVRPTCPISDGARAKHRISDDDLADAPSFGDLVPDLLRVFSKRLVLAYNFKFDKRLLRQSLRAAGLRWSREWSDMLKGPVDQHCIFLLYKRWSGAPPYPESTEGHRWTA